MAASFIQGARFVSQSSSLKKGWLAHYGELIGTWVRRTDSVTHDVQDAVHDVITTMLSGTTSVIHHPRAYLHTQCPQSAHRHAPPCAGSRHRTAA